MLNWKKKRTKHSLKALVHKVGHVCKIIQPTLKGETDAWEHFFENLHCFLSGGLSEVLQMAEFWSNRWSDWGALGGSELPAQESSTNPQHPVQHAPESSGETNTHIHRCDVSHKCGLTSLSLPQRVALSFDFPFYGHYLRQIIIATGGEFHSITANGDWRLCLSLEEHSNTPSCVCRDQSDGLRRQGWDPNTHPMGRIINPGVFNWKLNLLELCHNKHATSQK